MFLRKDFAPRAALAALAGFAGLVITAAPAVAQQPQSPCATQPHYADFDFWVGEWDVFNLKGQKAGENSIRKEEGGCLIVERWRSAGGGTGQSYNFYNPVTEEWRQLWVSPGAIIDYTGGLTDSGAMRLEGEIFYPANGQRADFFGEWTPQEDGSVRQHFEQFNAETGEWTPWFTGIYRRKED